MIKGIHIYQDWYLMKLVKNVYICSIVDKKAQNIGRIINNVARAEASLGPSMCRQSFQVNRFVEKAYVTLATGVCGTHA